MTAAGLGVKGLALLWLAAPESRVTPAGGRTVALLAAPWRWYVRSDVVCQHRAEWSGLTVNLAVFALPVRFVAVACPGGRRRLPR